MIKMCPIHRIMIDNKINLKRSTAPPPATESNYHGNYGCRKENEFLYSLC